MKNQFKRILLVGTLVCGVIAVGCKSMKAREGGGRTVASDINEDRKSVFGNPEFDASFKPKDKHEENIRNFLKGTDKSKTVNVEFPPGLTSHEVSQLWHLSEGSDVLPLRWFMHVKSQTSALKNTPLYDQLGKKFGVIEEDGLDTSNYGLRTGLQHNFPFKVVGITAAWSDADPMDSDATLQSPDEKIIGSRIYGTQVKNGKVSIAMVGTNCALCHTGQVQVGDTSKLYDGAPNMMYIRGFFQDMAGSVLKTMMEPELMEKFLIETGTPTREAKKIGEEFPARLRLELLGPILGSGPATEVIEFLVADHGLPRSRLKATEKVKATVQQALFEKRPVVQKYLLEFLALTYHVKVTDLSPTLGLRMKWLATLLGADPKIKVTNEGYARTDAFGRISNWVARGDNPIDLVATASVPPMWAIKYKAAFHYNNNTNSVLMRNVGQAFGLGAILTGKDGCDTTKEGSCVSTVNLYNLNRLESLLYKLKTPNWEESFPNSPVEMALAIQGCSKFQQACAGCHESAKRVGPAKMLIQPNMFSPVATGTDSVYAQMQGTPVKVANGEIPFRVALFSFTKGVRDDYFRLNGIGEDQIPVWQRAAIRGPEVFRDTYLGTPPYDKALDYMSEINTPGIAYVAKNLAGVWATAPYLHNGSIQNLEALLTPAKRPRFFFLGTKKYDAERLGFMDDPVATSEVDGLDIETYGKWSQLKSPLQLHNQIRCVKYPAACFDANDMGNSNKGHNFPEFKKLTAADKRNIIEFMKILRPDPEYSWTTLPRYIVEGQTCKQVDPSQFSKNNYL